MKTYFAKASNSAAGGKASAAKRFATAATRINRPAMTKDLLQRTATVPQRTTTAWK
jgi:hypothetical protein